MSPAAKLCFTLALNAVASTAIAVAGPSDTPTLPASARPATANQQWNDLVRHALLDDPGAATQPAGAYAHGAGPLHDIAEPMRWLSRAAALGHPETWLALGRAYEVARDGNEALTWYRLAANAGNVAARLRLGDIARSGVLGQPRDDKLALRWYGLAASQGNAVAEENIGDLCWQGSADVPRDREQAVRHYGAAASHGLASSQRKLAVAYANGDGAPADDASMLYWGRKAAEGGDAVAAGMLGYAIMIGVDGTYDLVEAATWLTLAAEHAHAGEWHNRAASYSQEVRNRLTQPELAAYHARVGRLHATLGGELMPGELCAGMRAGLTVHETAFPEDMRKKNGLISAVCVPGLLP